MNWIPLLLLFSRAKPFSVQNSFHRPIPDIKYICSWLLYKLKYNLNWSLNTTAHVLFYLTNLPPC